VISTRVMTPIVFCPSEVPCASAIIDADTVCALRNHPTVGSWSTLWNQR